MPEELALSKANRITIARLFAHVPRVDLSIDCIIEGQMGRALVDNIQDPKVVKLVLGPFFYLAGDPAAPGAHAMLADIAPYTLLMPSAPGWVEAAAALYPDRMNGFDRYSFSGGSLSPAQLNLRIETSPHKDRVRQMDEAFAANLWGQDHFIDLSEYESPGDFVQRGIGYWLPAGSGIAGAAYASLVCSRGIEVSLYVEEDYRRRGIATVLASFLLSWCLTRNLQANWDAASQESCGLAEKLGYTPTGSYRAYYLRG